MVEQQRVGMCGRGDHAHGIVGRIAVRAPYIPIERQQIVVTHRRLRAAGSGQHQDCRYGSRHYLLFHKLLLWFGWENGGSTPSSVEVRMDSGSRRDASPPRSGQTVIFVPSNLVKVNPSKFSL